MCSNVFKCVQMCLKLVQMCSNVVHKVGWCRTRPILGKWPKFLIQSFQAYNTELYTIWMSISYTDIEYLVRAAKSDIGDTCIKDEPKTNCIQHLRGERIAL